jgi:glycerol-3-phosphate dehydrogenase
VTTVTPWTPKPTSSGLRGDRGPTSEAPRERGLPVSGTSEVRPIANSGATGHSRGVPVAAVPLSPQARSSALASLESIHLDVLVVGGGVVGTGSALDAVSRGLTVGLVEMQDWASGTSSRSSKLIHGGLRYLEMLDFALVREALTERGLLLERLAPHLVQPVSFLYPLKHRGWERPYIGAGIALYDLMSMTRRNGRGLPAHRHLSRRASVRRAALRKSSLVGSILYWDAQVDDARHTMALARTAASMGAHVASRVRIVDFVRDGERVTGAVAIDLTSGRQITIRAKSIINATGVWTEETQDKVGVRKVSVKASKGIHIVVPRDRIRSDTGIILRTEKSVLFVIPWGRHWIIGTTDTAWTHDLTEPAITGSDIDYLLTRVNSVLKRPLTRDDIEGAYAGLRPLVANESKDTAKLSREHSVFTAVPGLTIVTGGKYTTYRVMAKDAVDNAIKDVRLKAGPCRTASIPVVGADEYHALWAKRAVLARDHQVPVRIMEHLLHRHGSLALEVLSLINDDANLRDTLPGTSDYLAAEALYAATHEGALHLDDILERRTRLFFEAWDQGMAAAEFIAHLVAPHLGWDADTIADEIERYRRRIDAANASQRELTDERADSVYHSIVRDGIDADSLGEKINGRDDRPRRRLFRRRELLPESVSAVPATEATVPRALQRDPRRLGAHSLRGRAQRPHEQ